MKSFLAFLLYQILRKLTPSEKREERENEHTFVEQMFAYRANAMYNGKDYRR